ncbi:hypothetical protein ACO0RG_001324 [Hanseniaspora osmophila]|uniref:Putative aminotransferase n=1 Tax=Hanseniaspora osmophila TaxID=56408 RepID=A0A1E5RN91_9ASCO|nr:putative aminotransferase [Hanseniaspora osmophila]
MTQDTAQETYVFLNTINKKLPQVLGGKGINITIEKDGKVYDDIIDAMTGAAVGALGWGDEDVPKIVAKAVENSTYTFPFYVGNQASEDLAKFYIDHSPKGAFSSALWCCSGSEANENAMKIIKQYWLERGQPKKNRFISRETSYHGFSLGALSISENNRATNFLDILIDQKNICLKMPACYPYRLQKEGQTTEEYVQELMDALEKIILDADPATVASVTIETLPGSTMGTPPPPPGYLPGIRRLCDKYDILMHLDEVMCGTGRANPNGGLNCWENYMEPGQFPDIQTVGKTLGSGYVTIAGILVGPKIKEAYEKGSGMIIGSHTYSSHAFNCAVALGVQQKIMDNGLTKNIFEKGNSLGKKLSDALIPADNIVGDVRGIGGFWSVEFVKDKKTKAMFPKELHVAYRFQDICFENGLTVMGMQGCYSNKTGEGDIALIAPAFIVTDEDIDEIAKRFVKSVDELSKALKEEGEW